MLPSGKAFIIVLASLITLSACSDQGGSSSSSTPSSGTTSAGIPSSDKSDVGLGQIKKIDFSSGSNTALDFSANSKNEDYLLILSAPTDGSGNLSVQLSKDIDASESETPPSSEEDFHQSLRDLETQIQRDEIPPVEPPTVSALSKSPVVGDITAFNVIASMTALNQFTSVKAKLVAITDAVYLYVDMRADSNIDSSGYTKLANDFTNDSFPVLKTLYGSEPDLNGDGHMTILMTCSVNTFATSGGFVTGFFNPNDMVESDGSNRQDMIYTVVPDPKGVCGGISLTESFTFGSLLPGVLPHEYQHMVSFYRHVTEKSIAPEVAWLNEAMSHLTESLTHHNEENYARVKLFFNNPAGTSLTPSGSPGLAERGAGYLFLQYLYEQSPDSTEFMNRLVNNSKSGVENIVDAFKGTEADFNEFPEFVNRWGLALALTDTGITADPRYIYKPLTTDSKTGIREGVCIRCDTQDGRGTVLGGPVITDVSSFPISASLKTAAVQFYKLKKPSGTINLNTQNKSLTGTLVGLDPH